MEVSKRESLEVEEGKEVGSSAPMKTLVAVFFSFFMVVGKKSMSLGVLNIAICIPQIIVSVGSGQFDALFGGRNLPVFVLRAVAAAVSAVLALTVLPSPPADASATKTITLGPR